MASTFYGLEIAKTGLFTNQKGLELTGHNVANSATEGYTRQRLNLSNIEGPYTQVIVSSGMKATTGGGVKVNYIEQVRNQFLDIQYRSENTDYSMWSSKAETFYYVEDIFNEPSDNGITSVMQSLNDSFQELQKTPDSKDIRNLVRQNAISLTETIQYYSKRISNLQSDENGAIEVNTKKANDLVIQIAELNDKILKYEMTGEKANDLMDKRNLALDNLSELIDISVDYHDDNSVSVYFGKMKDIDADKDSYCLVDGVDKEYYLFNIEKNKPNYYGEPDMFYTVTLTSKGGTIDVDGDVLTGGKLKANFDCRDGATADNVGMPLILKQLDTLAKGIVQAYNAAHKTGYGIPDIENGNVSMTGINFFEDFGNIDLVNANNITLSQEIFDSVYNIGASSKEVDLSASNTQIGNYENVQNLINVANSNTVPGVGNIENYIKSLVSDIGVQAEHCNNMESSQKIMKTSVENQRYSTSGVSIDEEMTNLISFQKAYAGAARVITAVDEMLDKLINGTGRCGL